MNELLSASVGPEHIGVMVYGYRDSPNGRWETVGRIIGFERHERWTTVYFDFVPKGMRGQAENAHLTLGEPGVRLFIC